MPAKRSAEPMSLHYCGGVQINTNSSTRAQDGVPTNLNTLRGTSYSLYRKDAGRASKRAH